MKDGAHKELPELHFQFHQSWSFDTAHLLIYRDETFKATLTIETPKNKCSGRFGETSKTYQLDGDIRMFESEEELLDAIENGPKEIWVYAGTTRDTRDDEEPITPARLG